MVSRRTFVILLCQSCTRCQNNFQKVLRCHKFTCPLQRYIEWLQESIGTNQPYDLCCDSRSFLEPIWSCTDVSFVRLCTDSDSRRSLSKIDSLWWIGLNLGSLSFRWTAVATSIFWPSLPPDNLCRFVWPTWKSNFHHLVSHRFKDCEGYHLRNYKQTNRAGQSILRLIPKRCGSSYVRLTVSHSSPYSADCKGEEEFPPRGSLVINISKAPSRQATVRDSSVRQRVATESFELRAANCLLCCMFHFSASRKIQSASLYSHTHTRTHLPLPVTYVHTLKG